MSGHITCVPSTSQPTAGGGYLEELLRKRQNLETVHEEPATPPRLPIDEEEVAERIHSRTERVQDSWRKADGNPADGRWGSVKQNLRASATLGRKARWIGVRTDGRPTVSLANEGPYWINAETESQWNEWEKRDAEERKLRDKIENWKKKLDVQQADNTTVPDDPTPISVVASTPPPKETKTVDSPKMSPRRAKKIATMKTGGNVPKGVTKTPSAANVLKDNSLFGFAVGKRSTAQKTTTGKAKQTEGAEPASSSQQQLQPQPQFQPEPEPSPASPHNLNIQHIADITDMSFLPPSFPSSAVVTSTPNPRAKSKAKSTTARKPDLIQHDAPIPIFNSQALPAPFPPSPKSQRPSVTKPTIRVIEPSASLPVIPLPSTPLRHPSPSHSSPKEIPTTTNDNVNVNVNNKRPASPMMPGSDDSRILKKARTLPTFTPSHYFPRPSGLNPTDQASNVQVMNAAIPSIPKDMSAAAPGPEENIGKAALFNDNEAKVVDEHDLDLPVTPKRVAALPTLKELMASAKKGKGKTKGSPKKHQIKIVQVSTISTITSTTAAGAPTTTIATTTPASAPAAPATTAKADVNANVKTTPAAFGGAPDVDEVVPSSSQVVLAAKDKGVAEDEALDKMIPEVREEVVQDGGGEVVPSSSEVVQAAGKVVEGASEVEQVATPVASEVAPAEVAPVEVAPAKAAPTEVALVEDVDEVNAIVEDPTTPVCRKSPINSPMRLSSPASLSLSFSLPHSNSQSISNSIELDPSSALEPYADSPVLDPYSDNADVDAILAAPPPKSSLDMYLNAHDYYADVALDSPTKSLSSIAGDSDDDEEEEEDQLDGTTNDSSKGVSGMSLGFGLNPPVTSTQNGPVGGAGAGAGGSGSGAAVLQQADSWASVYGPDSQTKANAVGGVVPPSSGGPAYNSQFEADVARQVDQVSRLLERDVDYNGWLRDPSPQSRLGMDSSP